MGDLHAFLGCETGFLVAPFVKVNNLHLIHMIFLISLQGLFVLSFLFFVKVPLLFHVLVAALAFFHFFDMIALALETGTPCYSFLIFRMYAIFLDGTSVLCVFKGFKTLHTLSAFWIKLSLSSFPSVNSQSVLRKLCIFISDIFHNQ